MFRKKHPNEPRRPLGKEEAMAILTRLEKGDVGSSRDDKGLINRLASGKDVAVPILLDHLRHGNTARQALASELLPMIGGETVKQPLWELARDPTTPVKTKVIVLGALGEMGENVQDEIPNIIDPTRPGEEVIDELFAVAGDDETLLQGTIRSLEEMPAAQKTEFIRMMGMTGSQKALRLLLPLLYARGTAAAAIEALEILGSPEAVPALNTLSQVSPRAEIRAKARTACSKLAMTAVSSVARTPAEQPAQTLPLHKAMVTTIDGDGGQDIMVTRKRADGTLKLVSVVFNDHEGIKDCLGDDMLPVKDWNRILSEFDAVSWVNIELPQCRAILEEAISLNKKNHRNLPMELEVWGPLLQDGPEAARLWKDEVAINISNELVLDPRLVRDAGDLLELKEFSSWGFDDRHIDLSDLVAVNTVRDSRLSRAEQMARYDLIVRSTISKVAKPRLMDLLERRLRRQAWLLERMGRREHSRLALAAASSLNKKSGIPFVDNHFLKELVSKSFIDMTAALEEMDTADDED
ncbi:MAG: hypothetical protein HY673_14315 [Chloroflexi bacterium]|nr:hypothetical protein [Chloroflexota bacterium]